MSEKSHNLVLLLVLLWPSPPPNDLLVLAVYSYSIVPFRWTSYMFSVPFFWKRVSVAVADGTDFKAQCSLACLLSEYHPSNRPPVQLV